MIASVTLVTAMVLAGAGLTVFVLVLIGARREHPTSRPPVRPPGPLAGLARRVLGLHVRQAAADVPDNAADKSRTHDAGERRAIDEFSRVSEGR